VIILEIDFDKFLNDHLEKLKKNNPDSEDNPLVEFNRNTAEIAARVCVSILKDYEALKLK
jgi:hypothetical protein